ncbi:hypothetical protein [Planomonospora parontospora]|uniref:hypothetical protein n=1 Tax=Planomonospora parontospora TaxID=58119 RepID=UPI0019B4C88B|nr:hypothetical protein [Planomonospora parontospora]GGL01934.1 hypothetical protein GCM10014719_00170 [Planomonospora parontospora subsp. antibiotica]GII16811.1 hypothetical protein Ppa05_35370 [Planomonospora parontospora subsp. antibiotica]
MKEAVYEIVEADGDPGALRGFIWFSKLVDDLGLFTFETYAAAREKVIIDQAEQLLELSTPVVKLWEGIVAVPLVGTATRPGPRWSWRSCCRPWWTPAPSTR